MVRQLRSAGALIVGKTNMHTLGMGTTSLESYFGPVRNPWMPDRAAGGVFGRLGSRGGDRHLLCDYRHGCRGLGQASSRML